MDFHCDDRDCFVEYKVEYNCVTYYSTNENCSIPCRLEFCNTKILHEVLCAVYRCTPFSTSTIVTTTATATPDEINSGNILSYCFNAFSFLLYAALCYFIVRKFLKKRRNSPLQVPLLNENERADNIPSVLFSITEEDEEIEDLQAEAQAPQKIKKCAVFFKNLMTETALRNENFNPYDQHEEIKL